MIGYGLDSSIEGIASIVIIWRFTGHRIHANHAETRAQKVRAPIQLDVNPDHTIARVTIPLVGDGTDARSTAALRTLRDRILPATIGTLPGASYAVTGGTASSVDGNALVKRSWPRVFAFILTFAFLLLLVSFRSLVIATKAIVLNLLSVSAAYGVLVAVSNTAGARACSASAPTAASPPGCRSSCS